MLIWRHLVLVAGWVVVAFVVAFFATVLIRRVWGSVGRARRMVLAVLVAVVGLMVAATFRYPLHFAMPPMMQSHAPGGLPASLPFSTVLTAAATMGRFERVGRAIGADPNAVPALRVPDSDGVVRITLTAKEVIGEVAPGVFFNYWTYDGITPGPMLRVRQGDTVELSLRNDPSSLHDHNIDLHSVTGPGGGAAVTNVKPGESKTFRWKALAAGLYEYHCAMMNVSVHNAHGQYGLILVEPPEGSSPVDREFYVMQGELYTDGGIGAKGMRLFDPQAVLDGVPTYVTFNGIVESAPRMRAKVGDRVRMYVGNGGVNLVSSFHVIGEIFDRTYVEGSLTSVPTTDLQTTIVPAGGSTVVEFTVDVPGKYTLVDHALARMNKGAWAVLEVSGDPAPEVFQAMGVPSSTGGDEFAMPMH